LGPPPREAPDPKLVEFLPDLAARGLLTERERMSALASKLKRLAEGLDHMLRDEGRGAA
jgi:hypothetical protein